MIYITRREHFNAAHKLFNPDWDDAKNKAIFGKCSNKNWHGHNYQLLVTIKGEINKETGFVVNLKDLGELINTLIIEEIDHKNLNLDVKGLQGILPSTENITKYIWDVLQPEISKLGAELHCIKLCETENNYVEYFGGK